MRIEQLNTNTEKKNKLNGLIITKAAIKQIKFLISLNSENKGIRLSIKKSGCAGFKYIMELVKQKKERELIFLYKKIFIYINSDDINFLDGVQIDFIKNNINKVFKFNNSKILKFCGCGESFSVN